MKKFISIICILLGIFAFGMTFAADEGVEIPYNFENGTVADANEVNAVFSAIATAINQNLIVMYDYGAPVNTTKIFEHTNSPTTLTSITTKEGMETWTYSDGSKVEYLTADSVDGTLETGRRMYDTLGVLVQDLTYFPAVIGVDIAGVKEVGKIWGNAYITKKPDGTTYGAEVNMYSIIGIETITVPAGTFENCTKVFHTTGNYKNVAWYAEGTGLIRRIGVSGLMELK